MRDTILTSVCLLVALAGVLGAAAAEPRHYIFFNRDRQRITNSVFLNTRSIEGAQIKYTWKELERQKDHYDFTPIEHDLAFLQSKGKKLFLQLQDTSFDTNIVLVPRYLQQDAEYHGGADLQYNIPDDDEARATPGGWVARRWDPAVQRRFHQLLRALGEQFDGRIEGINLPETAVDFGETGKLYPKGFSPETYRDAVLTNMLALKRAFPRSVAMQYANFMPGPENCLQGVYDYARRIKVAVGAPDLLPYKPWQMRNAYPLLHNSHGIVPTGIAVQEGNYQHRNPKTSRQVTIPELFGFATDYLKVEYIFWCTQEPYYSRDLIPFLKGRP